jgi:hypothetical protein
MTRHGRVSGSIPAIIAISAMRLYVDVVSSPDSSVSTRP